MNVNKYSTYPEKLLDGKRKKGKKYDKTISTPPGAGEGRHEEEMEELFYGLQGSRYLFAATERCLLLHGVPPLCQHYNPHSFIKRIKSRGPSVPGISISKPLLFLITSKVLVK